MATQFKLPVMSNKTFDKQPIKLDGWRYERCKFIDCKMVYSGGPVEVSECEFSGETQWDFRGVAATTLVVLRQCGWKFEYGNGETPDQLPPC